MTPQEKLWRKPIYCKSWASARNLLRLLQRISLPLCLLAVAGCSATTGTSSYTTRSTQSLGSNYLNKNTADPLGAYLASREFIENANAGNASTFTEVALNMLGTKYRFGGGAPSTGFDCSGLVIYAAKESLGLKLPRRSAEIARLGQSIKQNELQAGDLVFFNTLGHRFSHVGIYLGNHKFVHAPRAGSVVRVESMNVAYWKKRYNGARRLAQLDAPTTATARLHAAN